MFVKQVSTGLFEGFFVGKGSVSDEQAGDPSGLIRKALGTRSIVLVGMMGAGKSSVGKRLAQRLGLPFADAEGTPVAIHVAGRTVSDKRKQVFLASGTDKGFIKVRACVWWVCGCVWWCLSSKMEPLMAPATPSAC